MEPMLATLAEAPLVDPNLVYEPKYDGIRALVSVVPRGRSVEVTIASRQGNDKTKQFPEVVEALTRWGKKRKVAALFDGEIVALDDAGGADRIRAASGADPSDLRPRGGAAGRRAAGRLRRLRSAARRRRRSGRSAARRAARPAGGRAGGRRRQHAPDGAPGARRRHRADGRGAPAQLGGDRRQGRALDLQAGAAHARLAEAEAGQAAGAGGRRLHRAAGRARPLRGVAARAADGGRAPALRGARRRRLHRQGAGACRAPADGTRDVDVAVRRPAAGQREAALGPPGAGRRGEVRGVDDGGLPAAAGLPRPARRSGSWIAERRGEAARSARRAAKASPKASTHGFEGLVEDQGSAQRP